MTVCPICRAVGETHVVQAKSEPLATARSAFHTRLCSHFVFSHNPVPPSDD